MINNLSDLISVLCSLYNHISQNKQGDLYQKIQQLAGKKPLCFQSVEDVEERINLMKLILQEVGEQPALSREIRRLNIFLLVYQTHKEELTRKNGHQWLSDNSLDVYKKKTIPNGLIINQCA